MNYGRKVKHKVGDCIVAYNGIGKIIGLEFEQESSRWLFEVDFVVLASEMGEDSFKGGVVREKALLPPLKCNIFPTVDESEYAKAVSLVQMCEQSVGAVLSLVKCKIKYKI